ECVGPPRRGRKSKVKMAQSVPLDPKPFVSPDRYTQVRIAAGMSMEFQGRGPIPYQPGRRPRWSPSRNGKGQRSARFASRAGANMERTLGPHEWLRFQSQAVGLGWYGARLSRWGDVCIKPRYSAREASGPRHIPRTDETGHPSMLQSSSGF